MSRFTVERKGILFALSAPSGAGKTTASRKLLERVEGLSLSVSHTTRPMREGERDGVDYHFVDDERFDEMIERGEFVEWAQVHSARYGTSRSGIKKILDQGRDVLLDIDVQGAKTLSGKDLNMATIFFMPPSTEELEKRLRARGTDSEETIRLRLENARKEIKEAPGYDYIVINDNLDQAVEDLAAIVGAERLRVKNLILSVDDF